ncbi:pirin family protein [Vibrio splendidus]|uniref:pirin family protein n=2 Tax=Vibrio splendidus TaxID=29497 RepID=UPI000C84AA41|nr:pirin family protein [Vibrio splendidus]PMI83659.1 pirin [Vibrio splendidus]PMK51618.1 pirin [Vibrio splendidus]
MIRQIHEIRNGRNHGPVNSYVNSSNLNVLNPFLLWDHFQVSNVKGTAGFDFHGHSGVATISYPQIGSIAHKDTGGHSGSLVAGGIQIMSAGAGVLHKETVHPDNTVADAFQLWVALPKDEHEMGSVTYSTQQQDELPVVEETHSTTKVLVGQYHHKQSQALAPVDMTYLHINLNADCTWQHAGSQSQTTAFIFVRNGSVRVESKDLSAGELGVFEKSSAAIQVTALQKEAEFLIVSGTPLKQEFISNGASLHSSNSNLIAGVKRIKQLQSQQVNQ